MSIHSDLELELLNSSLRLGDPIIPPPLSSIIVTGETLRKLISYEYHSLLWDSALCMVLRRRDRRSAIEVSVKALLRNGKVDKTPLGLRGSIQIPIRHKDIKFVYLPPTYKGFEEELREEQDEG